MNSITNLAVSEFIRLFIKFGVGPFVRAVCSLYRRAKLSLIGSGGIGLGSSRQFMHTQRLALSALGEDVSVGLACRIWSWRGRVWRIWGCMNLVDGVQLAVRQWLKISKPRNGNSMYGGRRWSRILLRTAAASQVRNDQRVGGWFKVRRWRLLQIWLPALYWSCSLSCFAFEHIPISFARSPQSW